MGKIQMKAAIPMIVWNLVLRKTAKLERKEAIWEA